MNRISSIQRVITTIKPSHLYRTTRMASSTSLPSTIKAVYQPSPTSNALKLTTLPFPTLSSPTSYIIHVKATSPCLNELTWEVSYPSLFTKPRDRVPCTECAGVIVQAPPNGKFKPGDEVFYRRDAWHTGCLREYTDAEEDELALKPKSLSWTEAAATPLSALTAWQGLFEHGTLDKKALFGDEEAKRKNGDMRVLITGVGGAVGSWAAQFSHAAGAGTIIAVCSPSKTSLSLSLGATTTIDYTTTPVNTWASASPDRAVDLILDCVGGPALGNLWAALRSGATFLSVAGSPEDVRPEGNETKAAKAEWFLVRPRGKDLEEVARLVDEERAKPIVDSVWKFDEFEAAFEKVEKGRPKGKVVIEVSP